MPCPKCGDYQVLVLGDGTGPGLVWPEGKPEEAMYRCAGCRELIPHHQKAWMVERGEYRAQNPSSPIPGFRISQLISPKKPWGSIAMEFLAAKKSPETLKAFMNTVLAELWEENHEVPTDARALWNRCEPFEAEAPDGVALITAGVDVQADRLEVEIVGWGRDEESWSIALSRDPRRRHAQRGVGSPGRPARSPSTCTTPGCRCGSLRRASIAGSRMPPCCGSRATVMRAACMP